MQHLVIRYQKTCFIIDLILKERNSLKSKPAASKLAKLIKANPFELFVSLSLMILGTCKIMPKALNVSYKSFSSTSGSKLPIKRLAPISRFF